MNFLGMMTIKQEEYVETVLKYDSHAFVTARYNSKCSLENINKFLLLPELMLLIHAWKKVIYRMFVIKVCNNTVCMSIMKELSQFLN